MRTEVAGLVWASGHRSRKRNQTQVWPQVDSGTFLDAVKNVTVCIRGRQRSFSVGSNACRQNKLSSLLVGRAPCGKNRGARGPRGGVGSEDGGDNLARER